VWKEAESVAQEADLVVVFGTDHQSNNPFTLTRQHYATPHGVLPTAVGIVDALAEVIGEEQAFGGELRHIHEHSLELVLVWLHHMRRGKRVEIVPVLCGGFHHFIDEGRQPAEDQLLIDVLEALAEEAQGRNVLVVASGDLAHVGPAFRGIPMNPACRQLVHQHDEELFEQMAVGDAIGFFDVIRRVRDQYNVCGVSPIFLTMRLMELLGGPIEGIRQGYDVCPADRFNTSVVTIGGMLFQ
jgi:AmmeMemoRadiSam system protein B